MRPEEILDVLAAVLALPADPPGVASCALAELGLDSDLALLDVADAVAEEYGERTLGEMDLEELRSARTVGALAELFAERWALAGRD